MVTALIATLLLPNFQTCRVPQSPDNMPQHAILGWCMGSGQHAARSRHAKSSWHAAGSEHTGLGWYRARLNVQSGSGMLVCTLGLILCGIWIVDRPCATCPVYAARRWSCSLDYPYFHWHSQPLVQFCSPDSSLLFSHLNSPPINFALSFPFPHQVSAREQNNQTETSIILDLKLSQTVLKPQSGSFVIC